MRRELRSDNGFVNMIWEDTSSVAKIRMGDVESELQITDLSPKYFGKGTKFRTNVYTQMKDIANSLERTNKYIGKLPLATISALQVGKFGDEADYIGSYDKETGSVAVDPNRYPNNLSPYIRHKIFKDTWRDVLLIHELTHAGDAINIPYNDREAELKAYAKSVSYINKQLEQTTSNYEKVLLNKLKAIEIERYNQFINR